MSGIVLVVVLIEDVTTQSHYKSSNVVDQQVLDRNTLSTALVEIYRSCDAPPLLDEFTSYRDDSRGGLTFFTDPKYFFNLWLEEQNKQIEKKRRRVRIFMSRKRYCFCSLCMCLLSFCLGPKK